MELSKALVDGLQLWADDLAQLMETAFAEQSGSNARTQQGSGHSSLIGSRYFANASTAGSGTESGGASLANTITARPEQRSETAVKIAITEGMSLVAHLCYVMSTKDVHRSRGEVVGAEGG